MTDRDATTPVAVVLRRITLRDGANPDDFERCVLEEVFPLANTADAGEAPDEQLLLNGGDRAEYVWLSRLAYTIHQTPLPTWLANRVEQARTDAEGRLATFGTVVTTEVFYDVVGWRRRLGH